MLNRANTGALGGNNGYSKNEVIEKASKYDNLTDFRLNDAGYYEAGYRSDYWDEIRLLCNAKTHLGYTEDDCRRISKPYKELKVFMKEKSAVYHAAIRLGIKDEICEHMKKKYHGTYKQLKNMLRNVTLVVILQKNILEDMSS